MEKLNVTIYKCSYCGEKFNKEEECASHELMKHKNRDDFIKENDMRVIDECCFVCRNYNYQYGVCALLSDKFPHNPWVAVNCVCNKFILNTEKLENVKTRCV